MIIKEKICYSRWNLSEITENKRFLLCLKKKTAERMNRTKNTHNIQLHYIV